MTAPLKSRSERATAALDAAFERQIGQRFDAYNSWIAAGPHELKELGVDDPDPAFEAGMRELKAAAERAQTIIARVFGP